MLVYQRVSDANDPLALGWVLPIFQARFCQNHPDWMAWFRGRVDQKLSFQELNLSNVLSLGHYTQQSFRNFHKFQVGVWFKILNSEWTCSTNLFGQSLVWAPAFDRINHPIFSQGPWVFPDKQRHHLARDMFQLGGVPGKPWETMGNHGKPWETMGNHGKPTDHQSSSQLGQCHVRYVNPEGEVKGLTSDGNKIRDRIQVGRLVRGENRSRRCNSVYPLVMSK